MNTKDIKQRHRDTHIQIDTNPNTCKHTYQQKLTETQKLTKKIHADVTTYRNTHIHINTKHHILEHIQTHTHTHTQTHTHQNTCNHTQKHTYTNKQTHSI